MQPTLTNATSGLRTLRRSTFHGQRAAGRRNCWPAADEFPVGRRLPRVEVDPATPVVAAAGEVPLIDTFEVRRCRGTPCPRSCPARCSRRSPLRDEGLLPVRRRPRVRDVLDHRPRVRGDGEQLRDARHDGIRPPGAVGGLSRGLAAAVRDGRRPVPRGSRRSTGTTSRPPHVEWSRIAAGRSDDLRSAAVATDLAHPDHGGR